MKKLIFYCFGLSFLVGNCQSKKVSFNDILPEQQKTNKYQRNSTMPVSLYNKYRKGFAPDNSIASLNPTTYFWNALENKYSTYTIEFSMDKTFKTGVKTVTTKYGFLNLHKKQKPGQWYWRIKETNNGETSNWSKVNFYTVSENTPVYETPTYEEFLSKIPNKHPYIITLGESIAEVQKKSKNNPEIIKEILIKGNSIVSKEVLQLRAVDQSKYTKRNFLHNVMHLELVKLNAVLKAYLVSSDDKFYENATLRVKELLTWDDFYPLEEMFNAGMMKSFALYYDLFYDKIDAPFKKELKQAAEEHLSKMNKKWIGITENRQFNNHFWQVELAGYFTVALAYYKESEIANTALNYAYEIFIAKSPVLGGNDGGWANGIAYFQVNTMTIIDLAYLLYKVGGVPVFNKPWYQNLSSYYFYSSPAGAPINGFGDMHERKDKKGLGAKHSIYMHKVLGDTMGLYQFYKTYNPKKDRSIDDFFLTTGHKYNPEEIPVLREVPQDKIFSEVGEVAFHTDILNPKNDVGLYFRSSPYGANGHMHANQNCFNLSYKGEKVFYSSGYYTSFADPHSLTSYKHTRAHNGIVLNGKGQAYGNEGYGWIKKQLSGSDISYVCGDASQAYKEVTDQQWLDFISENFNQDTGTLSDNFGDVKLNTFDRHIILLRDAEVVLIYDVIEAPEHIQADLLLHSLKKLKRESNNSFSYQGNTISASTHIFSNAPSKLAITDQFYVKPIDFKNKFKINL